MSRLSDAAARKMDEVLSAKLFSGKHCPMLGVRLDIARDAMRAFRARVGARMCDGV
jgi:hypothetical protein